MIKYSVPLMKKRFTAETLSEAKTKALKWVGKNVMCKKEAHDIMYYFEEGKDTENCVVLILYVPLDEGEVRKRHCTICKEFHKSFFINENCNCNECKVRAYQERLDETIKVKKSYYRENLKKILEERKDET